MKLPKAPKRPPTPQEYIRDGLVNMEFNGLTGRFRIDGKGNMRLLYTFKPA